MANQQKNVFSGIIGHKIQLEILSHILAQKNFAHAYLFVGDPHLGKRIIAERFIAGILNLENQEKINVHPDVKIIEGEKLVTIDEIRELKHHLNLAPYSAFYKIVFLPCAEKMNRPAANSFLKLLEEPAGQTILILIAPSIKALLPTIVSRCQIFKFYRVAIPSIESFLKRAGASPEEARREAYLSQGCPGLSMAYFQNPEAVEREADYVRDLIKLKNDSLAKRFIFAEKFSHEAKVLEQMLRQWLRFYHDIILAKNSSLDLVSNPDFTLEIKKASETYSMQEILSLIQTTQMILQNLKFNLNKRLALETLLINI